MGCSSFRACSSAPVLSKRCKGVSSPVPGALPPYRSLTLVLTGLFLTFFFYYYYFFTSFRCLGFRILRFCSFTFAKVLYSGFTAASKKVQVAMAIPISMAMHHTARHRGVSVDAEHEAQTLWDC